MERSQNLHKGMSVPRSFSVIEVGQKYHQLSIIVKVIKQIYEIYYCILKSSSKLPLLCTLQDLNNRWKQYVTDHLELDKEINETITWLDGIKNKLENCSDLSSSSQDDLENKLETVQVKNYINFVKFSGLYVYII